MAVEEPVLDYQEAVPLGNASGTVAGQGVLAHSPRQPPKVDLRHRTTDPGPSSNQVALRSMTNGHIISPVAADTEANDHRERAGYWWSQGYPPAAAGGLLALGGIFGGLCWAGSSVAGTRTAAVLLQGRRDRRGRLVPLAALHTDASPSASAGKPFH
jgi:hypothetical protein